MLVVNALYLVLLCHRTQWTQQDFDQVHVVVASSHMQTGVPHLESKWSLCFTLQAGIPWASGKSMPSGSQLTLFLVSGVAPPSSRRRAVWACAFWQARWRAVFPAWIKTSQSLHRQLRCRLSFELLRPESWKAYGLISVAISKNNCLNIFYMEVVAVV